MSDPAFDFGSSSFKSASERVAEERQKRLSQAGRIMSFGVKFLDVTLGGIFPNDLILIGAKTGAGKTTLASCVAMQNAFAGRRVHYFALEAEEDEIERRIKYRALAGEMSSAGAYTRLNFLDWYKGNLDHATAFYEKKAEAKIAEAFRTLHTFYRTADFYAEQFERMVLAIQDQTDLIILDHLHYVDSEDANENRGYKLIVKKVRDVALGIGKPVIVVAHLRKGDRKSPQLVPSIEDFHGTSDVPKMCTKAVMIAPAFDQEGPTPHLWPTYISPAKCRFDGSRTRYVGLTNFDVRSGAYDDDFDLGKVIGDKWERIDNSKTPEWAK